MTHPISWALAPLADICSKITDGSHNPPAPQATGRPMLSAKNISGRTIRFNEFRLISESAFTDEDRRTQVAPGDVLLTIVGAIGRSAVVREGTDAFTLQRSVAVLKPRGIDPRLLSYALEAPGVQKYLTDNAKGTAQKGIYLRALAGVIVPVPPTGEQQRIADKLDTVLPRVDAVNDRLARVAPLLKRFRQAVLAAATSGRLTADWRDARPEGDWQTTEVQSIATVGTGSTPLRSNPSFFTDSGTPWVTSAATSADVVRQASEYVTDAAIAAHRLKVYPVGTLLVAMYGEGKTRGQVTELGIAATINQACAAVVVDDTLMVRSFVKLALQANYLAMRVLAEGGNQPNLNLAKVKGFSLPMPSLDEQSEIVRRVDILFAFADRLEARLQAAQTAAGRLTPALLAKAFRGELVPQDPADEPAAELLRRLSDAKTVEPPTKRRASRGSK